MSECLRVLELLEISVAIDVGWNDNDIDHFLRCKLERTREAKERG